MKHRNPEICRLYHSLAFPLLHLHFLALLLDISGKAPWTIINCLRGVINLVAPMSIQHCTVSVHSRVISSAT